jgi:hypothetical protein
VQCAENLPDPRGILSTTYSNTCWQNELFDLARQQATSPTALTAFAHQLDPALTAGSLSRSVRDLTYLE